jgi:hypothetical protein
MAVLISLSLEICLAEAGDLPELGRSKPPICGDAQASRRSDEGVGWGNLRVPRSEEDP